MDMDRRTRRIRSDTVNVTTSPRRRRRVRVPGSEKCMGWSSSMRQVDADSDVACALADNMRNCSINADAREQQTPWWRPCRDIAVDR
jgi:hypothetical protein